MGMLCSIVEARGYLAGSVVREQICWKSCSLGEAASKSLVILGVVLRDIVCSVD